MNAQTHQNAIASGGSALAVALIIKIAAHFGYAIDTDTAIEVLGLAGGAAVYVTQLLASRGVKLPPLPVPVEPAAAPVAPAQPAA